MVLLMLLLGKDFFLVKRSHRPLLLPLLSLTQPVTFRFQLTFSTTPQLLPLGLRIIPQQLQLRLRIILQYSLPLPNQNLQHHLNKLHPLILRRKQLPNHHLLLLNQTPVPSLLNALSQIHILRRFLVCNTLLKDTPSYD